MQPEMEILQKEENASKEYNKKSIKALVEEIGCVDILLNNAGVMNSLPYDAYPEDKKENLMNVNLYAPIEFITHMAPLMMEQEKVILRVL